MAAKKTTKTQKASEAQPFGAGAVDPSEPSGLAVESGGRRKSPARSRERRRGRSERPKPASGEASDGVEAATSQPAEASPGASAKPSTDDSSSGGARSRRAEKRRRWQDRKKRKKRKPRPAGEGGEGREARESRPERPRTQGGETRTTEGILLLETANHGHLRSREKGYLPARDDVHVTPRLVQKYGLREGALLRGSYRRGQGRHKWELFDVETVDGKPPAEMLKLPAFKSLTSIDPDFHYAVGDATGEVSLKVVDLLSPVGRGQRGLIVAPPRSGKTILLQQFAKAIETVYPEVHLMVLLVDERPEEATEWQRSVERAEVFVSTNDEMAKKHVELCEVVWRRCRRLVEMGEDVILLLDSITRMGRAYNNVKGTSGKTMSGGIDTRALERPKQFFGSARNTETAGSLTILATTLIETGSRMDQVIFEEFKGTGNMELVLSRKLADRRIFPAIDLEKTGTRKEEKLHSSRRLKLINTLRRVLMRMHWAEAMELLITKLDDYETTDEFLQRFEVDPEA